MEVDILIAEIGSTTTVVNAFMGIYGDNPKFIAGGQAPTTVLEGDVTIGLNAAIESLKSQLLVDEIKSKEFLATSSAAGGLKMSVHGLVYDMTVRAAKEAALGAGANLKFATGGKLSKFDLKKIKQLSPNIILLAGGVDFGERDTAIFNAEMIASLDINVPVIYAGNIACQEEIREIFIDAGKEHLLNITTNVYPKIDTLNVEPVRKIIQEVFEDNIMRAPGMEKIRTLVTGHIMPTPGAVMEATKLFYDEFGDVTTLDVGGATTDVSSVTEGSEAMTLIMLEPEPTAKRTVEGDLGCFVSKHTLIEAIGVDVATKYFKCDKETLESRINALPPIPKEREDIETAEFLATMSVSTALNRHCGSLKILFEGLKKKVASGKDLSAVKYIIGTGGALTRLPKRVEILKNIPSYNKGEKLFPTSGAEILIDNDYIMASLGVLSLTNKEAAINLLMDSLKMKRVEKKTEENSEVEINEKKEIDNSFGSENNDKE